MMSRDPGAHGAGFNTIRFEHHRPAFSKPCNRLPGRGKPRVSILQILNQVAITCVPQPLRSEAAIMPVDRDAAPKLDRVVYQSTKDFVACLGDRPR